MLLNVSHIINFLGWSLSHFQILAEFLYSIMRLTAHLFPYDTFLEKSAQTHYLADLPNQCSKYYRSMV